MGDIKRHLELFLVERLTAAVPGHQFLPMTGFGNDPELEPPFTVVTATDSEKMYSNREVYYGKAVIQIITHSQDTPVEEHSKIVKAVSDTMKLLTRSAVKPGFVFSGSDVHGMRYSDDEKTQTHADLIDITWGAELT